MRKTSHTQNSEPVAEYLLSMLRFQNAAEYIAKNSVVADFGCGFNGNFLRKIAGKIKQGVGFDISVSSKMPFKNIYLKKANLNKQINDRKNYYGVVTALAVLEHVENPEKFLKEINLMLKRNGKLIITTPHKRSKQVLEFLSSVGIISKDEIADHKNYFDEKSLAGLMRSLKFKILKLKTFEAGLNLLLVAQKN